MSKILGCRGIVLLHDAIGHPLLATTGRGDQHLTIGLPAIVTLYHTATQTPAPERIVVDREGMAAAMLRDLYNAGHTVVTILRTNQYTGVESFTDVGAFAPLDVTLDGPVWREVASARFALRLPPPSSETLPLSVARIREWRTPTGSETAEARRIPSVTTADTRQAGDRVAT